MLMVGFALPSIDKVVSDNVKDLVTNFGLGAIAHEFVLAPRLRILSLRVLTNSPSVLIPKGINDKTLCAYKNFGTRRTVIDSRCGNEDGIRCYGLILTVDVEGRETRLEVFPERITTRVAGKASRMLECAFDSVNRYPTKEGTKTVIVNQSCGIGSFIDVILSMSA